MEPTRVAVYAHTPLLRAGVTELLRGHAAVQTVPWGRRQEAAVLVVAHDHLKITDLQELRATPPAVVKPIVLVAHDVRAPQLLRGVECGVRAVVSRLEVTADSLVHAITAVARGAGEIPAELLGPLLDQLSLMYDRVLLPNGLTNSGLTEREINVLALLAEGKDTTEVAEALWYSQRTVKNIIQGMITRLHLRNRAHAVAYAARSGDI
jgi:DNA-binding NarL/FixJ family response regulator